MFHPQPSDREKPPYSRMRPANGTRVTYKGTTEATDHLRLELNTKEQIQPCCILATGAVDTKMLPLPLFHFAANVSQNKTENNKIKLIRTEYN